MMKSKHSFRAGDTCIFTNRGASGVTKNDGKRCRIVRLKPQKEWYQSEPEYVTHFLDGSGGFGCRECELTPHQSNKGVGHE